MSNNDGRVIINIDSNASKTQKDFEALDTTTAKYNQTLKNTQNTANSSKSALSSYGNQLKVNKTSASALSGALGSLGGSLGSLGTLASGAAAGFALLKLKDYGQYALQTSAAFEQLGVSFRVMTGSAQLGQELTNSIIELGAKTPMTAQQLAKAAQLLLSFGESAENIIPDLQLLGDITGGEVNRFNQLALAFAQVGANGKLMGQDQIQMVNAGFNPLQAIAEKTGKTMGELRKEMEMGRISFQMVAQAMKDATNEGGRYFGLTKEQSETLNGRLTSLDDTWEQVAKSIGDVFVPAAKTAVNTLISLGEKTQDVIDWLNSEKSTLIGLKEAWDKYWASKRKSDTSLVFTVEPYLNGKKVQNKVKSALKKTGDNTGFYSGNSSPGTSSTQKQKDAFERLQEAAKNARREVELNAVAYGTSSPQVQQAFEKYRNLNTQLNDINKIFDENTKKVTDNGGAYAQLQDKISKTRDKLLDMAVSGQRGSIEFTELKNALQQYENQVQQANTDVSNSVGLSWKTVSNTISSQLSYALTTPLQEGENAFERLGNVALNVIGQIAQAWLSNSLNNMFSGSGAGSKSLGSGLLGTIGSTIGSIWGGGGSVAGGILGGALDKFFADGAPLRHGRVVPFAGGGVVGSPTMFPMSGNRTGLMGERGAEAIMPLKRTPSGQLGVQAQVQQPSINIYNQSGANIETVQRPDGETDIFIRKVNSALKNERTQAGFSSALQRNQSRGVQAS